ncbi:AlpA family transcriptional regulator [Breznakibacter xylanolyticus]|uniref:AlpA family transcriptional regulator n=1 Tax=Breznakibacter xylanolyticus TaxID=990 RepID=A0A2W7NEA4_9BACT|nr:helix-turn-helix domain-containing protein [Breznakibacter xylanolyticus]PZX16447.1 AlpA family transcriptional regulator [Breznakibacter xylanolyticus]
MKNIVFSTRNIDDLINDLANEVVKRIEVKTSQSQIDSKKNDELLSIEEASTFLKLTVPTIYSKVSKGELPVMKRGKRLYFSQNELMDYLKQGRKRTNEEIDALANCHLSNLNSKGGHHGK